jgi:hypothetical protein
MKTTSAPSASRIERPRTAGPMAARRRVLLGLGAGVLSVPLAHCASAPPKREFAEITFAHEPPLQLDVARVEFVDGFVPPAEAPHAEIDFPVPPAAAARRWVVDRLQAVGTAGTARATLTDASGLRTDLPKTGGVTGYFTTDQARRYEASIVMRLDIMTEGSRYVEGFAEASAKRSDTIPEDSTLNERDARLYALVEKLMGDFDGQFEITIRRYLAKYIR